MAKWKSEHPRESTNARTTYVVNEEGDIKKFVYVPDTIYDPRSKVYSPSSSILSETEIPLNIVDLTYMGAATKEIILRVNPQFDEERRKAREQTPNEDI